ncbi:putative reverse transcriptase domain-containing protein [Tanacetum coccineum]
MTSSSPENHMLDIIFLLLLLESTKETKLRKESTLTSRFAIGNGLTDPLVQYKAYTDYALYMGIGDNHGHYDIRKHCEDSLCYDFSNMEDLLSKQSVTEALGVIVFAKTVTSAIGLLASTELPLQHDILHPVYITDVIRPNPGVKEAAILCIEVTVAPRVFALAGCDIGDTQEPHNQGQDMGDTDDQLNVKATPKHDWFKKSKRPLTPNSDWNVRKSIDFRPPQTWISKITQAEKSPLSFDELMSTPIDFSAYVMNHL